MTRNQTFVAVVIAMLGSAFLWIVTPWNDFFVRSSYLCDSYLPAGALALVLLLVIIVNPILYRYRPALALGFRQILLITGIMFVASTIVGTGLLRQLPHSVAATPLHVSEDYQLSEALKSDPLRPELFPARLEYEADVPVSEYFVDELPEGESIPWKAWVTPAITWGIFLVFVWFMIMGMSQLVVPQWRDNERLSFPLLTIVKPLMEEPEEGSYFAGIFRNRIFWAGVLFVMIIHLANGYHERYPTLVPAIPLQWNIRPVFTEGIFRHIPWHISGSRIYFVFLGAAYFMRTRTSFSIWFFVIIYAVYRMIAVQYLPPYHEAGVTDHRMGAMFMMAAVVVYLGRRHFKWAVTTLWKRVDTDEGRVARRSVIMFLAGAIGMCAWFCWNRVSAPWAFALTLFGVVVSLIIARIVAETGMPFIRMQFGYDISIMKMVPGAWLSIPVLFFIRTVASLFSTGSRMALSVMATHTLAADKESTPKQRWRLGVLLLCVILIGLVVCGASHLTMGYNHSTTLTSAAESPLNVWGTRRFATGYSDFKTFAAHGELRPAAHSRGGHMLFGAGLALALEVACLHVPAWPLHPIGLLMVNSYYSNAAWVSVFLGWLMAVVILRFGGARVYRTAAPFFIGVIVGDILASAYWSIESAIMALLEIAYSPIWVQPS